ncbi:MAG TPA: dipeptide ABC transporter ATP-binding protein [Devosiaceae bacterium]|nr:dipeptide ABC transporter ATP-binding protein [Devosiaceae bacterium]
MTALITAEHLERDYEVTRGLLSKPFTLHAVSEATFAVEEGTTLAIVGESGCGKSTLARMLTMIEPPTGGQLVIDGRDVSAGAATDLKALRATVQIVFQNPYGSLNPRQKIGAILEEPLKINTRLSAAGRQDRAQKMLAEVGLRPEHYGRYPHMFSGGQRQRIAIARALMLEPKILVLDEPVSALDVSIQAQILNLLADLQERRGLTYVFISHALAVVRHVADNVMVMYLGRGVEIAPAEALFETPRHPYTQALLAATPIADPERRGQRARLSGELPSPFNPPKGCPFNPRCPFANDRCRTEVPQMLPAGETIVACHGVEEGRIPVPAHAPVNAVSAA